MHKGTLQTLGYVFRGRSPDLSLRGVTGPVEDGFSLEAERLFVLRRMLNGVTLEAFELGEWAGEGVDVTLSSSFL